MLRYLSAFLLLFLSAALSEEPLTFASDAAYPPFAHLDASGEIVGLERDLAEAVCALLDRTCAFVLVPWSDFSPAVARGEADVAFAGLSATTARHLGLVPLGTYLPTPSRFVALEGDPQPADTNDLGNYVIGALWGTPHAHWLEENLPSDNVRRFPDAEEMYLSLHAGTVDLVFNEALTLYLDFLRSPLGADTTLTVLSVSLATDGGGHVFAAGTQGVAHEAIERALDELAENGTLARLIDQHLPGYQN